MIRPPRRATLYVCCASTHVRAQERSVTGGNDPKVSHGVKRTLYGFCPRAAVAPAIAWLLRSHECDIHAYRFMPVEGIDVSVVTSEYIIGGRSGALIVEPEKCAMSSTSAPLACK